MKKLFTIPLLIICLYAKAIPLKLVNKSIFPIPLIIPGVMNPNLFPFSSSSCGLEPGQTILFNYKGKEETLIIITEEMSNQRLIVNQLIRERKKELNKEKK